MNPETFCIDQIGIVVSSLEAALPKYEAIFGGAPWRIWTYGPNTLSAQTLRGEPAQFEMRIALSSGHPQIELIEPVSGENIYSEWLAVRGEGLHHLGMFQSDPNTLTDLTEHGFDVLQSGEGQGLYGDGAFAYYDSAAQLGYALELIQVPIVRREPERIWPQPQTLGCAHGSNAPTHGPPR